MFILTIFLSLTISSQAQKKSGHVIEIEKTNKFWPQVISKDSNWVVLGDRYYDEIKAESFFTLHSYDSDFNEISTLEHINRPSINLLGSTNTTENRLNYYKNTDGELLLEKISYPDLERSEIPIDDHFGEKWTIIANTKFSVLISKLGQVFVTDLLTENTYILELDIPETEKLTSLRRTQKDDKFYIITKEKSDNTKLNIYKLHLDDGLELLGSTTLAEHNHIQYLNVFEYFDDYILYVNVIPGKAQMKRAPSQLYIVNLSNTHQGRIVKDTKSYLTESLLTGIQVDSLQTKIINDTKLVSDIYSSKHSNYSRVTNTNLVDVIQDSSFFVSLYEQYITSVSSTTDDKGNREFVTTYVSLCCYVVKTDFDGNVIWSRRQVFEKGIFSKTVRKMTTLNRTKNGFSVSINNNSYSEILQFSKDGSIKSKKYLAGMYLPEDSKLRWYFHTLYFWNDHTYLRFGERKVKYPRSSENKSGTVYYLENF